MDISKQSDLMKKFLTFNSLLVCSLFSNDMVDYQKGLEYYKQKEYKKSFPIILDEAKRGNKEAGYLIASFYENGYGVKQDIKKSLFWYKKVSSNYSYIVDNTKKSKKIVDSIAKENSEQKALQFIYSKVDQSSNGVKTEVEKIVNKDFGIIPYKSNYILPFSVSKNKYTRIRSNTLVSNEEYESNTEAEFQISFQKNLAYNLLGLNEYFTLAYTQQVWWQIYSDSSPFRETNYTPEFFVTIPTSYEIDKLNNLKAIKFGFRHQSNGQDGSRSRSWDRLFLSSLWQWDNLFLKAEAWYRIPESEKDESYYNGTNLNAKGDDNPDIQKYLGYGDIELKYLYDKNQFGLMLRNNLRSDNKGAIQIDWTAPFNGSKNTYWYLKAFNGYGESLIDYDKYNTKVSFGFSFFRNIL
jgi:phospholipase A1